MVSENRLGILLGILLVITLYGLFNVITLLTVQIIHVTGAATGVTNVTVGSSTAISLVISNVDFGTMNTNDNNDTTDDNPAPFILRNDGNLNVNISINATPLWEQDGYNITNESYRVKCGNTTEWNCTPASINTFTNLPIDQNPILIIHNLTYQNIMDEAEVEVNVTVPPAEPDGNKGSTVTFTATQT